MDVSDEGVEAIYDFMESPTTIFDDEFFSTLFILFVFCSISPSSIMRTSSQKSIRSPYSSRLSKRTTRG